MIKGTALNHGGQAASSTAPNPRAQTELVRAALHNAGLTGQELGYIEAHGTATPLGDPIEWQSLTEALRGTTTAAGPQSTLWVGSVKSFIGHLEGAAGLAGLLTAALVVRRGRIPGMPGFREVGHRLVPSEVPLAPAAHGLDWPANGTPRTAGVSAFGLGGSNAHVVVQEPAGDNRDAVPASGVASTGLHAFPLSAASAPALRRLAGSLADLLSGTGCPHPLEAVAATLQFGRDTLPIRRLVLATDRTGLVEALRVLAADGEDERVFGPGADLSGRPHNSLGDVGVQAAGAWLEDGRSHWEALGASRARAWRVPLVPYPFQRRSYWLPL